MAIRVIQTSQTLSSYTQRVQLDGREYVLGLQWNERHAKWYLSIRDESGDTIASGLKLVANWPVNRLLTDPRSPGGIIIPMDTSGSNKDPGLEDLGRRVLLVYVDADTVNESL